MKIQTLGRAMAGLALGCAAATSANAVEVIGTTEATLRWSPAAGSVSGYYVIVARDGGEPRLSAVSDEPETTVGGAYGETLVLQVAAFDAAGVAGPLSEPSEPFTFLPTGSGGSGDGGGSGGGGGGDDGGGAGEPDPGAAAPLDFTADGYSDLVVRTGSDVSVWALQGSHVGAVTALPFAPNGHAVVGSGDFDANGTSDLLWENATTGERLVWLLDAGTVVASGALARSGADPRAEWQIGGVGDFDGDGRDDVMLFSRVLGTIEIWYLDGPAVGTHEQLPGRFGPWSVSAVADLDGDRRAEVVWRDELASALEISDADGSLDGVRLEALDDWRAAGAGDFDGDGRDELLMREAASGALQAWSVGPGGATISDLGGGALAPWSVRGVGDYDANGLDDLAWHDADSGEISLWLLTAEGVVEETLEPTLGEDAELVYGRGSDDSTFQRRFCEADLDGNSVVDGGDYTILIGCYQGSDSEICEDADLDSDGMLTARDVSIFTLRFRGERCAL